MSEKIEKFNTFLQLLERFSTNENDYKNIIHQDVTFIEYPNLVNKNGQKRNYQESMKGLETAKKILSEQKYEVINYTEAENKLISEVIWTGKMSMDIGHLKKDQELKAYICMIIDFKDEKIIQQKNYDCYEPLDFRLIIKKRIN